MAGFLTIVLIASNKFIADPDPGITTSFAGCLGHCHQSDRCASFFYNFDTGKCYPSFYVYSHPSYTPFLQTTVENVEYYEWKMSVCNGAYSWYYHRPNRICFKYMDIDRDQPTAKAQCVSEGATLIAAKNYLSDIFFAHFSQTASNNLWTGGYLEGSTWYWAPGDPLIYTNWREGFPQSGQECLKYDKDLDEWKGGICSKTLHSMCQLIVESSQDGCYLTLTLPPDMRSKLF